MDDIVHATALALGDRGVLVRGPSGSGKSDLALRLMALPATTLTGSAAFTLVADDQVELTCRGGEVFARPPPALAGLLEVRGVGIIHVPYMASTTLRLVVDLVRAPDVPRLPDLPETVTLLGVELPRLFVAPFEASAPIKLALALAGVRHAV